MTDKQIIKVDSLDELYITQLQAQLKAKEQECEEFKEKLRTKARGWANVNDQILKELAKIKENYKQTIIEIKEIAEKKCLGCTNFCNDESIRFCVTKQILQKISEVVDGKNS